MAGGVGSRFWPMSRSVHPKQFLDILGTGRTLLQQTYDRFLRICPQENIFVVTNESYTGLVAEQLPGLSANQILGEPQRRNTAPCIAYATYKVEQICPDANFVVAPSDHIILKEEEFTEAIEHALSFTDENDSLVTLGIRPNRPDTGYGYIQFMEEQVSETFRLHKVRTFTEKPNQDMAKFFLQSGEFLWNSGIFVWNLKTIRKAFEKHLPEMHTLFLDGKEKYSTGEELAFIKNVYTLCTNISIDYGVMEKAANVFVLPSEFGWSDLGTWSSLYEHSSKDQHGNAVIGKNVLLYESENCIINMPREKLVIVEGLKDYILVESDNILLICRKDDEQQIRQFVNDVKIRKGEKFT